MGLAVVAVKDNPIIVILSFFFSFLYHQLGEKKPYIGGFVLIVASFFVQAKV